MAAKPPKTKAPSGMTLTRTDSFSPGLGTFKFTLTTEWKIGDSDYEDGQQYIYESRYVSQPGDKRPSKYSYRAKTESLGKTATSKVKEFDYKSFYPFKDRYLYSIQFFVRGNRKSYTTGTGKKKKTINPSWSGWYDGRKEYVFMVPPKPILTAELTASNKTNFSWELSEIEKINQCFVDFEYESLLVQNNTYTVANIASANWSANATNKGNTSANAGTKTGNLEITEDTSLFTTSGYSYTRWFRVRARGPRGWSDWVYANHTYSRATAAKNVSAKQTTNNTTGGVSIRMEWEADTSNALPIDEVKALYAVTVPDSSQKTENGVVKTTLLCPSDATWEDGVSIVDTTGKDGMIIDTSTRPGADKVIFVKAETYHDGVATPGKPILASAKDHALSVPTISSITPVTSTHRVTINATNASDVSASFLAVYYKTAKGKERCIGIMPHGTSQLVAQAPDWGSDRAAFGVRAIVGDYYPAQAKAFPAVTDYSITNVQMQSITVWDNGTVPAAPSRPRLTALKGESGTIVVEWDWTWGDADSAELSWAESPNAWESTSQPSTYIVTQAYASKWHITGLAMSEWYVRVRLIKNTEDGAIYSGYSDYAKIKLASAPSTPSLTVLPEVAALGEKLTCTWVYTSQDGSDQAQAEICTVTGVKEGNISYGPIVAKSGNAQFVTINTADKRLNWQKGQDYFLSVRVKSASGETSENWSTPKKITIANKPTISITSTSLVSGELRAMPLTINATGTGTSITTSYIIERAEDYFVDRPDESRFGGFEGETVAMITKPGGGQITINQNDLLAPLDDGARYRIIVTVKDAYGQSASTSPITFKVKWSHQALMPTATVQLDEQKLAAYITPIAPSGTGTGDVCDIYRLSVDKPELIYENAAFGTKYVDPYPTLGEFGGHRIVFKTVNGDYITASNQFAWRDYPLDGSNEDGHLNKFLTVIDFGGDRIELPYDIEISNSWTKDFTQTHYLGGSIQGDWNEGIDRKTSVKTTTIVEENPETIEQMRRLAEYPGICHVRTPEGSSFSADVQITEDRENRWVNRIAKFSISITRVDAEGFDGEEYDDWIVEN